MVGGAIVRQRGGTPERMVGSVRASAALTAMAGDVVGPMSTGPGTGMPKRTPNAPVIGSGVDVRRGPCAYGYAHARRSAPVASQRNARGIEVEGGAARTGEPRNKRQCFAPTKPHRRFENVVARGPSVESLHRQLESLYWDSQFKTGRCSMAAPAVLVVAPRLVPVGHRIARLCRAVKRRRRSRLHDAGATPERVRWVQTRHLRTKRTDSLRIG